jgi:hypothetical protein
LNGYASKYGNAVLTEIPPSAIKEIQMLCHGISTYMKDQKPNIEEDNLKAFNKIYARSSALVIKIKEKKQGTTKFFEELQKLLADLKNISLALIPAVVIATEVIQSNILTSSFN